MQPEFDPQGWETQGFEAWVEQDQANLRAWFSHALNRVEPELVSGPVVSRLLGEPVQDHYSRPLHGDARYSRFDRRRGYHEERDEEPVAPTEHRQQE